MNRRSFTLFAACFTLAASLAPVSSATAATVKKGKAAKAPRVEPAAPEPVALQFDQRGNPIFGSSAVAVVRQSTGEVIFNKNGEITVPIASITKLMTAMVVLDARQRLSETLAITADDIDQLKGSGSRLIVGTRMTREEMLQLALMSSENRAASALARHYPGGGKAFVEAMNVKARMIGMWETRFIDSTGLDPRNVSTPADLARLVSAAATYPLIRDFSTTSERHMRVGGNLLRFGNTNALVRDPEWQVGLSKTGFIREAGRCVVMQAWVKNEPVIIVLMNASGSFARTADAKRVKHWLETNSWKRATTVARSSGS